MLQRKWNMVENRLQARLDEHELAIMSLKQENIKIKEYTQVEFCSYMH